MKKTYKIRQNYLSKVFFDKQNVFFYVSYDYNEKTIDEKIIFDDIEEFNVFIIRNDNFFSHIKNDSAILKEMYNIMFPKDMVLSRKIATEALVKDFFGNKEVSLEKFSKNHQNFAFLLFFNYISSFGNGVIKLKNRNMKILIKNINSAVGILQDNRQNI